MKIKVKNERDENRRCKKNIMKGKKIEHVRSVQTNVWKKVIKTRTAVAKEALHRKIHLLCSRLDLDVGNSLIIVLFVVYCSVRV